MIVGLLFAFFQSLNWLTNHGQETKVPQLTGKNMKAAVKELKAQGFTIVIDSTYQSYKNPLEVIFQEPEAGAVVKKGRTIFLTVNRKSVPTVPMPNLVNLSFRNALLTMASYRLVMGDTMYRPDIAAGSVLEQLYNGRQIRPGDPVPYGSRISLVIGEGLSDIQDVPNLIGSTWYQAKEMIESLSLNYNILWEGTITDTMNAIVFKQEPEALNELDFKNSIPAGDLIDVYIMQNPSPELLERNKPGSGKLIGEDSAANEANVMDLPKAKKDTTKAKRPVPGTAVPNPSAKAKEATDTKKNGNNVKPQNASKPSSSKKPTDKKGNGVQSSGDKISNEYE